MINLSVAFKAALASHVQTFATILRVQLTNSTVLGFTDHDQDIVYDDGSGSVTYQAAFGYEPKNVTGALDLSVDQTEYVGMLNSPSITEADLKAGIWDYAAVKFMMINWADTTMGVLVLRKGHLGKVTVERNQFTAEIRGMMQAYSRTIGELTSPSCRAEIYDSRCKVNPAGTGGTGPFNYTVTGTITGVIGTPQMVLQDSSRTEPGPPGGVVIASISNTNPGHVTLATGGGASFNTGEAVMLSGCLGGSFPTINTVTVLRNLSGDVFDLAIDTTSYGSYTANSGTCTPLGANSGWFDYGLLTFTSGNNTGLAGEVANYVPGQWTMELPFPYTVQVGDTYSMKAGCDKAFATCKNKFSNVINMRAEPYLPGIDKIVQVGKQPGSG